MSDSEKMIDDYQKELIRLSKLYKDNGLSNEKILYGLIGIALLRLTDIAIPVQKNEICPRCGNPDTQKPMYYCPECEVHFTKSYSKNTIVKKVEQIQKDSDEIRDELSD